MSRLTNWLARKNQPVRQSSPEEPMPPGEQLDHHLQRLFALLQINCVLDVGANQGQYGRRLRQMGYQGTIISFEPASSDFQKLQEQTQDDDDWLIHHLALGDEDSTALINVTSDSLFNSFLAPNDFITGQGLRIEEQESVEVRRLDTIFEQCLPAVSQPRIYLKVDTQGYDLKVLAGAGRTLPQILALQSELSVRPVYQDSPDFLESIATLTGLGFDITGLFPIARDNALRVIEFDCVMVSRQAAGPSTGVYPP
jgi:FkbM family methyltransferase